VILFLFFNGLPGKKKFMEFVTEFLIFFQNNFKKWRKLTPKKSLLLERLDLQLTHDSFRECMATSNLH
jgi:hypothetical protein